MRTVILHYHLFKNAGTSVDKILKDNFGENWVTAEFPNRGADNSDLVAKWIEEESDGVAFSSHTMLGPIPFVEGVRIVSFMLLREPISRIQSAYRFERQQDASTWGAQIAKEFDFTDYVRKRLSRKGDRQCKNFQTFRLATLSPDSGRELDRAKSAASLITVLGTVEKFSEAMERLSQEVLPDLSLELKSPWENKSDGVDMLTSDNLELLQENNKDDYALLKHLETLNKPEK